MTADEKEVSMNINKIGSHHLRSYTIHASNPLGNTTFTLNLSKKPGTRAQPLEPIADERTLAGWKVYALMLFILFCVKFYFVKF